MLLSLRSFAVSIVAVAILATHCLGATLPADGYAMRVWQTEDGLPQNMVTSAVQTSDGYLWFGTYNGLARFDGERFEVFDSANTPDLQDRRITCLFEDSAGTLWIGHETGAITCYRDGRFLPYTPPSENSNERPIGLGSDEQGRLWAMRQNGVIESVGGGLRIPSPIAPALPGTMAWSRSTRGDIWLAENGRAARLASGKLAPLVFGPPGTMSYVHGIAAAADGAIWILADGRIRKWKDGGWAEDRGEFPWTPGSIACCLELRDGTLAVGTIYSGLYLVFKDGRRSVHIDRGNGLPQNWVRFLHEDREGNIWVGAGSAGIASIHATAFSVLNAPDRWQGCTVLSVAPGKGGALWIGTEGAGLYRFAAGEWTHYGDAEGLTNPYIPAVAEGGDGEVWTGHFWWGSPYRLDDGHFVRSPGVDETSSPVFALLSTPGSDQLLVGNRDGLLQLASNRATWLFKAPTATAGAVCAIARDRAGAIWCGFGQGGLVRFADGKTKSWRMTDGLPSDAVQCLWAADNGALWIGTADRGLTRFKDGCFATLGLQQGLADRFVGCILDDGLGHLWLSTHHGLQRVAKDDLDRCADGLIPAINRQIYDQHDGLPTIEFTGGLQAAGCRDLDGRLWFASSKGLVGVDPARIQANTIPPPVIFDSLLVDGNRVPVAHDTVLDRLPPDHRRLEFRFSGLSFVAPNKVRFRYRLEGIDQDWIDASTRRSAFYSRLPAGSYRFRVTACNNDGVWNTEGAALTFGVAPFFWQTWWFLGSTALVVLAGVASFARHMTRRRMQRRLEQLERQRALEHERSRIAQDIHDDIGTSLSRIAIFSQPDRAELDEPRQTAAMLARIYTAAGEMTRSLDEIVWAIDPRHDTLESMAYYMSSFAQDLLAAANIRCRLDLPPELPLWPINSEMRHNLFLAFKETLNNTVKHAAASEVRISLQVLPNGFVLVVKDDGRGFDRGRYGMAAGERFGARNGLRNLEQRLARINGRCEIASAPGAGTTVSFLVDVPA